MKDLTVPCKVCGCVPARQLAIRRLVGMVVLQRSFTVEMPLCRTHGVATTKTSLARTLVQGWWGVISFFYNWFVVVSDLVVLLQYRRLARPTTVTEAITGQVNRVPAPPGRTTGPVPRTSGSVPRTTGPVPRSSGEVPLTVGAPPDPALDAPPDLHPGGYWGSDPYSRFPLRWYNGQYWSDQVAAGSDVITDEPGWR